MVYTALPFLSPFLDCDTWLCDVSAGRSSNPLSLQWWQRQVPMTFDNSYNPIRRGSTEVGSLIGHWWYWRKHSHFIDSEAWVDPCIFGVQVLQPVRVTWMATVVRRTWSVEGNLHGCVLRVIVAMDGNGTWIQCIPMLASPSVDAFKLICALEVQFLLRRGRVRLRSKDFYVHFSDTKKRVHSAKVKVLSNPGEPTSCVDKVEHSLRQFQRTSKNVWLQTSNLQMDLKTGFMKSWHHDTLWFLFLISFWFFRVRFQFLVPHTNLWQYQGSCSELLRWNSGILLCAFPGGSGGTTVRGDYCSLWRCYSRSFGNQIRVAAPLAN